MCWEPFPWWTSQSIRRTLFTPSASAEATATDALLKRPGRATKLELNSSYSVKDTEKHRNPSCYYSQRDGPEAVRVQRMHLRDPLPVGMESTESQVVNIAETKAAPAVVTGIPTHNDSIADVGTRLPQPQHQCNCQPQAAHNQLNVCSDRSIQHASQYC